MCFIMVVFVCQTKTTVTPTHVRMAAPAMTMAVVSPAHAPLDSPEVTAELVSYHGFSPGVALICFEGDIKYYKKHY